jgi:uncharacterized protein (TIGR03382 family)
MRACSRLRSIVPLAALVSAGLQASCGGGPACRITDSFSSEDEGMHEDTLHDYVVGTAFSIDVRTNRWGLDLDTLELVSKDPEVLEVRGQSRVDDVLRASMFSHAEGTATLVVVDAMSRPVEERVVRVLRPDAIGLSIEIDRDRGFSIPEVESDKLTFAVQGRATFAVRYERAGDELKGSGVLRGVSDTVGATNPTRTGPDREFLALEAPAEPTDSALVPLEVSGEVVRMLEVRAVEADAIASVELDLGEPGAHWNGTRYPIWAEAFDDDGAPIFGAPFRWTFDGERLDGDGDVLTYAHEGGERVRVQVKAGDVVEDVSVEAQKDSAELTTAAGTTCCSGGPAPAPAALLAGLWLVARRRRR